MKEEQKELNGEECAYVMTDKSNLKFEKLRLRRSVHSPINI